MTKELQESFQSRLLCFPLCFLMFFDVWESRTTSAYTYLDLEHTVNGIKDQRGMHEVFILCFLLF